ncbi:MAG: Hint domain-containing protein [Marinosulfonomonas sp.]|nr:Hint domain-containing protein [Marinosulfonomonas sp.]
MTPNKGTSAANEAGIAMGTIVLTLDGEIPVEHLNAGDRVITRDSGMAVLTAVHMREITMRPYKISADRLGEGRPEADTYVAGDQHILVRGLLAQALFKSDSALVPVSRLADGEYIAKCEEQTMRLYELEFDTAHVVYANGLEVASAVRELALAA